MKKYTKKYNTMILKIKKILNNDKFNYYFLGLILLIGCFWFFVTYKQYEQYAYRTGDTPVAEQAIWNTINGRFFYQSFLQTENNFREHLNFVQFIYLPLYAIFPHTLTLFFIIQAFLIFGAIYLYFYVKRKIGIVAAIISVGIFIFNPLTASQAVGDMHVVTIAATIFLMVLIAYHEKKYKNFLFWIIATLLVSEFVAPTVFLIGIVAFLDRRSLKWILSPIFGGVGLYMATKYYVTIGFGSSEYILSKLKPEALMNIYKLKTRMELLSKALAPLLWIFPFISKYSILLLPSIAIALFIIIPGRIAGGSHVFILIVPILNIIFIDLLEKFKAHRKFLYAIAIIGIIISFYPWFKWMEIDGSEFTKEMDKAVNAVKDRGSLTASTQFGPKVDRREEFFLPMNEKMTDYVLLKLSKTREEKKNSNELESNELKYDEKIKESGLYRTIFEDGRIVLFVKKEKIAEILNISTIEIEKISDINLQKMWNDIK